MVRVKDRALGLQVEDGLARLTPRGDWTIDRAADIGREMRKAPGRRAEKVIVDCTNIDLLDTAGAVILTGAAARWRARGLDVSFENLSPIHKVLMDEVAEHPVTGEAKLREVNWAIRILADTGRSVAGAGGDAIRILSFLGAVVSALLRVMVMPWRLRGTSIIHHMEHTGFRSIGIIGLLSFLIGGIIAQQGAFQLRKFGAEPLVVDLVAILVLREIGVLLTAIMYSGRSGSAFTAEIGSMKMREEIDAMRIIGIDPVEALFLPRIIALVLTMPMVTFVADMMALLGAGLVANYYVGISPDTFILRLQQAVGLNTFLVGMFKAPFLALVVGLVACVEGMKVKGSAESLGRQTTASVVKSIFIVILLDGVFAIFFSLVNW